MSAIPVRVNAAATLTNSFAVLHSVYKDRYLTVRCVHIANTSGAPLTVQMCFCAPSIAPAQGNAAIWDFSIPANDFIEWGEGLILPPLWTVQGLASGDGINVIFSGTEE